MYHHLSPFQTQKYRVLSVQEKEGHLYEISALTYNALTYKALTYKIEWEKELRRRAEAGIETMDEPIPHPDHIKIDFRTGEVRIVGPMTKEEKKELDYWRKKLPDLRSNIDDLREALVHETDPDEIADLRGHIRTGEELYERVRTALAVVEQTASE